MSGDLHLSERCTSFVVASSLFPAIARRGYHVAVGRTQAFIVGGMLIGYAAVAVADGAARTNAWRIVWGLPLPISLVVFLGVCCSAADHVTPTPDHMTHTAGARDSAGHVTIALRNHVGGCAVQAGRECAFPFLAAPLHALAALPIPPPYLLHTHLPYRRHQRKRQAPLLPAGSGAQACSLLRRRRQGGSYCALRSAQGVAVRLTCGPRPAAI